MAGSIDFDRLHAVVAAQYPPGLHDMLHGPAHWRAVERNGFLLAERTGADVTVVRLFALFHDSRRKNDGDDAEHAVRGAAYAAELHGSHYSLDLARLDLLLEACRSHTSGIFSGDRTIATCWDADRLDLPRVGIRPNPALLSTPFGREIAGHVSVEAYLESQSTGPPSETSP
jgi:uncharacterized protein